MPTTAPTCLSETFACTISRPNGNHERRYVSANRPRSSPWNAGRVTTTPSMAATRVLGLEAAVAAPEKRERAALFLEAERVDASHDDDVVAGAVLGVDDAVDPGQPTTQHRRAVARRLPVDAGELVGALGRHQPAELLLVLGEDVDAELAGRLDPRPRTARVRGAERDERRVERDRRERVGGQPDRLVAVGIDRGDDGDAGGEVAEHRPVQRGVDRRCGDVRGGLGTEGGLVGLRGAGPGGVPAETSPVPPPAGENLAPPPFPRRGGG